VLYYIFAYSAILSCTAHTHRETQTPTTPHIIHNYGTPIPTHTPYPHPAPAPTRTTLKPTPPAHHNPPTPHPPTHLPTNQPTLQPYHPYPYHHYPPRRCLWRWALCPTVQARRIHSPAAECTPGVGPAAEKSFTASVYIIGNDNESAGCYFLPLLWMNLRVGHRLCRQQHEL
jgi:hypothetical protein